MLTRLRHWCHRSRVLLAALLVLTFLWHPALIAASEAHESEHLVRTGHAHDAHAGEAHADNTHAIVADESPDPEGDAPWHELLHAGHCCGHAQAMPIEWHVLPPMLIAGPDIAFRAAVIPAPMPTRLLRPPIP